MLVFELDRETVRVMAADRPLITAAATLASFLHRDQTRMVRGDMPRVPYIEHPLRVALRLIRWGVRDAELVAAALLHDVVEDCAEELLEVFGRPGEDVFACLARLFSERVAQFVIEVTNPAHMRTPVDYLDHVTALVESGSAALLIKASDLKDNAGSIAHQLGHGKDAKLRRMMRKYLPTVKITAAGLRGPGADVTRYVAADQMEHLLTSLQRLAAENEHSQGEWAVHVDAHGPSTSSNDIS